MVRCVIVFFPPANGAFVHEFATASASTHVATLQHDTVHRVVHTDLAQFVVIHLILACAKKNRLRKHQSKSKLENVSTAIT